MLLTRLIPSIPQPSVQVGASNLAESFEFDLDLDLDMSTFTEASSTFSSDVGLDTLFLNVSDFLEEVASYGPELEAGGDDASSINGLLSGKNVVLKGMQVVFSLSPH